MAQDSRNARFEMPEFVRAAVERPAPADGRVQVWSRGRIEVRPETYFCSKDPIVQATLRGRGVRGAGLVGLRDYLESLGLPADRHGTGPNAPAASSTCENAKDVVVEQAIVGLNAHGGPYRLTLAFWHGDTAWVGTVERKDGGPRPQVFNPYGGDALSLEISADVKSVSDMFLPSIAGEK